MDITIQQFNKVLDVLLTDNYDYRALVERIARTNPQAIIDSMKECELKYPLLEGFAKAGEKIQAIKHVRNISGFGLREAKEFVEDYIAGMGL